MLKAVHLTKKCCLLVDNIDHAHYVDTPEIHTKCMKQC